MSADELKRLEQYISAEASRIVVNSDTSLPHHTAWVMLNALESIVRKMRLDKPRKGKGRNERCN